VLSRKEAIATCPKYDHGMLPSFNTPLRLTVDQWLN